MYNGHQTIATGFLLVSEIAIPHRHGVKPLFADIQMAEMVHILKSKDMSISERIRPIMRANLMLPRVRTIRLIHQSTTKPTPDPISDILKGPCDHPFDFGFAQ
jgi:hypothetical protein